MKVKEHQENKSQRMKSGQFVHWGWCE